MHRYDFDWHDDTAKIPVRWWQWQAMCIERLRDNKLGRDVALKVLPDAFAADPQRMARFKREARGFSRL